MLFVHYGDGGWGSEYQPAPPSWDAFSCFLMAISILLTVIAIILVLVGWIGFWHFGEKSKRQAEEVAKTTSENIAEDITNKYLRDNLEEILAKYGIVKKGPPDAVADEIAKEESK